MLFELVAGLDTELAERFAQVVVDGVGADEQLRGDLLVGRTVCGEARDLCLLGSQVVAGLDGPFAGVLAGRLPAQRGPSPPERPTPRRCGSWPAREASD